MVDNVAVTPGSGSSIATDDIAGVQHQRVKITLGADGVSDGDVASGNPMPVTASSLPLPTGAATSAKQPALGTAGTASADVLTVQGIASMTALKVDGSAVTQPVSGTFWQATQPVSGTVTITPSGTQTVAGAKTNNNAAPGATNVGALVGLANAAAPSYTEGNQVTLRTTLAGDLAVTLDSEAVVLGAGTAAIGKLTSNSGVTIGAVEIAASQSVAVTQATASSLNAQVVGPAAHDAAISGNPLRIAGRALTSDYTAVAAGDTADIATTLTGKLINVPFALPGQTWSYAAASGGITNTTGVTIKAAGGAGVRNYITCLSVINGHATQSTDVQIRDGASGTVLWRGWAQAAGGGVREMFSVPIRGTANTLLEVACGTTGAAVYVNVQGFTAAE